MNQLFLKDLKVENLKDLEELSFADLVAMQQEIKNRNWKDDEESRFAVGLLSLDVDNEIGKRLNIFLINRAITDKK